MEYLLYILAGFGIFSILVLMLKLIVWCFSYSCDKQFVPIAKSRVYANRNSMNNIHEKEAIDQFDKMLEQYTQPKVVISRQCICPFCTKQTDKIVFNNSNEDQNKCIEKDNTIFEECDDKSSRSQSIDSYIEVDDIVIIDDSKDDMPCNTYNNVILELKNRFSAQFSQTEVKKFFDSQEDKP